VSSNGAVMYGAFPPPEAPRSPEREPIFTPPPAILIPCATCNRHIYAGTMCPFCFAAQVAKAPSRAALEAVKKSLEDALRIVNEALGGGQ
jgi:hypothetical protein